MKKAVIFLALVVLAGCATKPIQFDQAKPVPSKRLYAFQDKSQPAKILVTRDSGYQGFLCGVKFYIDGKLAAQLETSEKAIFYVPEGAHTVSADHNCHGPVDGTVLTTTTEDSAGLRISVGINGAHVNPIIYKQEPSL